MENARDGAATGATMADFAKIDLRVGRILTAERSAARKPTYRFLVDFGPEIGQKQSCAALVGYPAGDLVGALVVAVVNFPPKRMGPERSEVLILGVPDADGAIVRLQPERDVPPGARVF